MERMTWVGRTGSLDQSLKSGGEVGKLPETGFYYRIRKNSRRKSTNKDSKPQDKLTLINSSISGLL